MIKLEDSEKKFRTPVASMSYFNRETPCPSLSLGHIHFMYLPRRDYGPSYGGVWGFEPIRTARASFTERLGGPCILNYLSKKPSGSDFFESNPSHSFGPDD